tara:strand:- start:500 stop:667 length:168 start_codon:yes stop_codon:yes gene_type:complete
MMELVIGKSVDGLREVLVDGALVDTIEFDSEADGFWTKLGFADTLDEVKTMFEAA